MRGIAFFRRIAQRAAETRSGRFGTWFGGLMAAGLIGAAANSYFERPRLGVEVVSIGIREVDPASESEQEKVLADPEILALAAKSSWAPQFESKSSLQLYLLELRRALRDLSDAADRMSVLRESLDRWPRQIHDEESVNRIIEILWSNDDLVNEFLIRNYQEDQTVFRSPVPTYAARRPYHRVESDSQGYYIALGRKRLQLVCQDAHQHSATECARFLRTAGRLAHALAFGDSADLVDFRNTLQLMLNDEVPIRTLTGRVEEELKAHSYWYVRGLITNSGKNPVSISPDASFYLNTDGRKFRDSKTGVEHELDADIRVFLRALRAVPASEGRTVLVPSDEPIVIDGGEAISVVFRSTSRIRDLKEKDLFAQFFPSPDLYGRLAILPITSHVAQIGGPSEPVLSTPTAFAQFSVAEKFPKEVGFPGKRALGMFGFLRP